MPLKFSRERGITWDRSVQTKQSEIIEFSPQLEEAVRWGTFDASWGNQYRRSMAVYTVGQFIAWQIGQVGLKFYRRQSAIERESRDELTDFFKAPVEGQTYPELMEGLVWDRILFGNEYWNLVGDGLEGAIQPLPPFAIKPDGGSLTQARIYVYDLNGTHAEYDFTRIAHFKTFNPIDRRVGVSPLDPLRPLLREEAEMAMYRIGYYRNSARIEGVIERPADTPWSDEAFARFRDGIGNTYAGARNSGKTLVLEDSMHYNPASWSPRDSEFLEGRKFMLKAVAQALNVPASILGLTETATFASEKEFHKQLYVDTLGPWFASIEAVINERVVPWLTPEPDVYCEFNVAEKMQGDFQQTTDALSRALGSGVGHLSINEARALENRPPIGDPNDPENPYNQPVIPSNVLFGGTGEAPPAPAEPAPAEPNLRAVDGAR
jgi:HK97 family phage portal protein